MKFHRSFVHTVFCCNLVIVVLKQWMFCRHVILPPDIAKLVPKTHLMTETEWRNLGVQQSPGWVHYMVHTPGEQTYLVPRKLKLTNKCIGLWFFFFFWGGVGAVLLTNRRVTTWGGGYWGFMWFVIGEILSFVMREFKILFSVTCDGSICHDTWCFKFNSREAWWDHLIYVIDTQFSILKHVKVCLFAVDAGRDLWCVFFYFLWSVMGTPQYPPPSPRNLPRLLRNSWVTMTFV